MSSGQNNERTSIRQPAPTTDKNSVSASANVVSPAEMQTRLKVNPETAGREAEAGDIVGGHYRIEAVIGSGGMATVYRARHLLLDRPVALKVLKASRETDGKALQRFQQEARVVSCLDHANIVRLQEFGVDENDRPFLVMGLVEGQSIDEYLKNHGKMTAKEALTVAIDIADALEHAHEKGIIHRDLKPSNIILLKEANGALRARVVDFGIAKLINTRESQKLTQTGDSFGSPTYMSPEQCMGNAIDQRSDIYSLACVIFEMLTGRPVFQADLPIQVLAKHLNEKAGRLIDAEELEESRLDWSVKEATMIAALDNVLARALSKAPEARYANASALRRDLLTVRDAPEKLARNLPLYINQQRHPRELNRPVIVASSLIACVMLYAGFASVYHMVRTHSPGYTPPAVTETVAEKPAATTPEPPEGGTITANYVEEVIFPPLKYYRPVAFKETAAMFNPQFVFDGLPSVDPLFDTNRNHVADLKLAQVEQWKATKDEAQLAHNALKIGQAQVDINNFVPADEDFTRVFNPATARQDQGEERSEPGLDLKAMSAAQHGFGDVQFGCGNYAAALVDYQRALKFLDAAGSTDALDRGLTLQRLAMCQELASDGKPKKEQEAAESFKQAQIQLKRIGADDGPDRQIIALTALGDLHLHLKQYDAAVAPFTRAEILVNGLPARFEEVNAFQRRVIASKLAYALGMSGKALESIDKFKMVEGELGGLPTAENSMAWRLGQRIALAKANIAMTHKDPNAALVALEEGIVACRSDDRETVGVKATLLKFAAEVAREVNDKADEREWLEQNSREVSGLTHGRSLLPSIALVQNQANHIYGREGE